MIFSRKLFLSSALIPSALCLGLSAASTPNVLEVRIDRFHIEYDLPERLQDGDRKGVLEVEFPCSHSLRHLAFSVGNRVCQRGGEFPQTVLFQQEIEALVPRGAPERVDECACGWSMA